MAKLHPVVRYMAVCEEMEVHKKQISLLRLVLNIRSLGTPPYPLLYRQLCVFAVLTEARGNASVTLRVVHADTGAAVFAPRVQHVSFGKDPLTAYGVRFRLRDCLFPQVGLYWIQFLYGDAVLAQQDLYLR
jgi:Family of unknown function (DUF6941)